MGFSTITPLIGMGDDNCGLWESTKGSLILELKNGTRCSETY